MVDKIIIGDQPQACFGEDAGEFVQSLVVIDHIRANGIGYVRSQERWKRDNTAMLHYFLPTRGNQLRPATAIKHYLDRGITQQGLQIGDRWRFEVNQIFGRYQDPFMPRLPKVMKVVFQLIIITTTQSICQRPIDRKSTTS